MPISLPADVLGEVFEHVPIVTLKNVTLACHEFRNLGLRRLFRTIHVFPENPGNELTEEIVEDILEKQLFYASDKVSRYVLSGLIRAWATTSDLGTASNRILEEFFDLLSHFSNLEALRFDNITFNHQRLSRLALISAIKLSVVSCNLVTNVTPLPSISARDFAFIHMSKATGVEKWLGILDRNHLRHVVIMHPQSGNFFPNNNALLEPFSAVESCTLFPPVVLKFPTILELFPALRRLEVFGSPYLSPQEAKRQTLQVLSRKLSISTPPLVIYHGPVEFLPLVAAPSIRVLKLGSFQCGDDPNALAEQITAYKQSLQGLEFIRIGISHLSINLFSAVSSFFPNLKTLVLEGTNSRNRPFTPNGMLDALSLDELPASIECFAMQLSTSSGSTRGMTEEITNFRDRLLAHAPSLKFIWLMDRFYVGCLWEYKESGPVTEIFLASACRESDLSSMQTDVFNNSAYFDSDL